MKVFAKILAATALILAGCGTGPEYPSDAPECTLYWISYQNGPPNIWTLDFPDGKPRQFTFFDNGCGRWGFDISPSGECYVSAQNASDWNIYRITSPGAVPILITSESQYDGEHAISPDGGTICFVTKRWYFDLYDRELALMDPYGGNIRRLTVWRGSDDSPAWSVDGSKIAYVREFAYGQYGIMVIEPESGDSAVRITDPEYYAYDPIWTPNGQSLICVMTVNGIRDIFEVPIDGSSPTNITGTAWTDEGPALSPDGGRIAHRVYRSGQWDIAVTRIGDGVTLLITDDSAEDMSPCWSPDGSWLFWVSRTNEGRDIFCAPADGSSGPYRITDSPNDDIKVICR